MTNPRDRRGTQGKKSLIQRFLAEKTTESVIGSKGNARKRSKKKK